MKHFVIQPGLFTEKLPGKSQPGLDLTQAVKDVLKNCGLPCTTDCCSDITSTFGDFDCNDALDNCIAAAFATDFTYNSTTNLFTIKPTSITSVVTREIIEDLLATTFPGFTYDDASNSFAITTIPCELVQDCLSSSFPFLTYNDGSNNFSFTPGTNGQVLTTTGGVAVWGTPAFVATLDNGLTLTGSNGQLGGTLLHDTTVSGAFNMTFANVSLFRAQAGDGVAGSAISELFLSQLTSSGSYMRTSNLAGTAEGRIYLDFDNPVQVFQKNSSNDKAHCQFDTTSVGNPNASIGVDVAGVTDNFLTVTKDTVLIEELVARTTETNVVWWDVPTGRLAYGAAASTIVKYHAVQTLINGTTTVTHNLSLATPAAFTYNILDSSGTPITTGVISNMLTNSFDITLGATATNALVTVIG